MHPPTTAASILPPRFILSHTHVTLLYLVPQGCPGGGGAQHVWQRVVLHYVHVNTQLLKEKGWAG